ncbi:MAG TPA: TonB-dependent receptor [Steroidobacteraceae bacterium]|nr:TonB-dependent receptor [Steroidobacteraceae bacterium]
MESLLQELRRTGIEVIYSSELVAPALLESEPRESLPPLQRAQEALAAHGLELRTIAPGKYVVVVRAAPTPAPIPATEPLEEISVYASRYAIESDVAEPRKLSGNDIEMIPGSHDDALHAVRSLPGMASNASGRPYIRGSLSEDILVRYDGIGLLDPFHLKNFQSLISAIDPAGIESIEVFSGGFPVRYGQRSGGVIDISAPTIDAGHEYRANLSLISGGVSSIGKSEQLPLEWLAAIRRSTLDIIDPVEDQFGKPQFSDSLGRLRWATERGAWTLGWLLLDDRLELGVSDDEEKATARYRDEYVWLAREHKFSDSLTTRGSLVVTSAVRGRQGTLVRPDVASGALDEMRKFNGLDFSNDWTFRSSESSTYTFGGAIGSTNANYRYSRVSQFSPEVAAAFGRAEIEELQYLQNPHVVTVALYGANRRRWSKFEAELGVRFDAQHYERDGNHSQVSPRINLRYDMRDDLRLYASAGRFTQAQHVEEWRVEEAQQRPDAAQVSIHSILGLEYDLERGGRIGIEAYSKQWTTAAPYFDSQLDPLALLPDLSPDRVRVVPQNSEASGLELRARMPLAEHFTGWGTLSWARVADDFRESGDIRRSWDQPLSLTAGLAWKNARASFSVLGGWHRGWPRTPVATQPVDVGIRNSERWGDFYTLDLRGSWSWQLAHGDFAVVLDVTNATNRANECCAVLESSGETGALETEVEHWLPTIFNIGFTYRWRSAP